MTALDDIERDLASPEPEDRRQAAARLADESGDAVVPLLIKALGDEDWRVRKEATLVAVFQAPSAEVLRGLVETFLPGDNVGLRNAAVEALAGYGQPAVDALAAIIPALDADGRKLAVEALGRTGLPSALVSLGALIGDPDANVRAAVTESISAIGATCIDAAVPLLERCLDSDDRLVRLAALDGLNRLAVVLPWSRLERLLADPVLERAALLAAGRSAHVQAAPLLTAALERSRGALWESALLSLADFARVSALTLAAARSALARLSPEAQQRLVALGRAPDEDWELRRAALGLCGALASDAAAEALVDALADDRVADAAEHALGILGSKAVPALIARTNEGPSTERALCLELLGRLSESPDAKAAIDAAHTALSDDSSEVLAAALALLAAIGDEDCLETAATWACAETTPSVRKASVAALAALALRHPEAARALARRAAPEAPEAQVSATITAALGKPVRETLEADIEFLSHALSNDSTHVRRAALEAFAALSSALGVEAVAFALTDEERDVQLAAVRALGRMRAEDGTIAGLGNLLDLIQSGEDAVLSTAAIRALGQAGDARAMPVLKPLVRSVDAAQAVAAVEALGNIADPRRVEVLTTALGHPDTEVVKAALRVLAQEHDPRVPAHVGACLDHEAWDVRRLAADLLGDIAADASSELLRAKLSIEPEPLVKDAVQRALGEVEGASSVRRTMPPPHGSFRPR